MIGTFQCYNCGVTVYRARVYEDGHFYNASKPEAWRGPLRGVLFENESNRKHICQVMRDETPRYARVDDSRYVPADYIPETRIRDVYQQRVPNQAAVKENEDVPVLLVVEEPDKFGVDLPF